MSFAIIAALVIAAWFVLAGAVVLFSVAASRGRARADAQAELDARFQEIIRNCF